MPSTYTLISSNVLGSSAASVTFSAIPSTYTDLVLKISARQQVDGSTTTYPFAFAVNANSGTSHSYTTLRGTGSSAGSFRGSNQPNIDFNYTSAELSTSNTFGSEEIYITNYASTSVNKPLSLFSVSENNNTSAQMSATAAIYRSNTAITSLIFATYVGNFVSGSSFYLYGITNS